MSGTLMSGARTLLECLVREKVDCMFGYPGGVTLPLYDALYDHPLKHILVRHEENACFAAEGYARATGKVGVCCATSGPGATNLVTGLVDAMMDSIPIVAITGQVSTKLIGSDAFQEADTFGITRSCTKHNFLVKKLSELPQAVHEAFHIAATGRPGPVLVDIPKDVFQAQAHYVPVSAIHLPGYKLYTEGHAGQIRRAVQMIWEAQRPFVYAGGGILAAGASEDLREFVERIDAPAVCTLMGLGALASNHPNFISLPGMHGSYAANMGMTETDLLIALGVRFDDRVTGRLAAFAPHAKVIHVDIDPAEIGKNRTADVPIVGDVKRVLEKLNQALAETASEKSKNETKRAAWWMQIKEWQKEHPLEPENSSDEIKPQHLVSEIDRLSGGEAIVCSDVGQHQMWAAQRYRSNAPRNFITSGGLGSMGFALPAAVGVQLANPDATVLCISGDGGFQMNIQELATVHRLGLPIKMVIIDNKYLGMVRQWQQLFYDRNYAETDLSDNPNFVAIGYAYGINSRRLRAEALTAEESQTADLLDTFLHSRNPELLVFECPPEANVFPMVPSGATISEMMLEEE
jgi:acetolactate synthase I/II/III large subunit